MQKTLIIETATAACSVALIEGGEVVARRHEVVGRGHAERLVPMIVELPGGGRAARILVDVGPGSFTGVRVGIAAARGLALGWGVEVAGFSSLAVVAARRIANESDGLPIAVVLEGGHCEVFMQLFAPDPLRPLAPLASLPPAVARERLGGYPAVGDGLRWLGSGDPREAPRGALPDAADAVLLPPNLAALPPPPALRPRARCEAATAAMSIRSLTLRTGNARDIGAIEMLLGAAFDPRYGEAWTRGQCLGVLAMPGVRLTLAELDEQPVGFALVRAVVDEAELLLIAVAPRARRRGVGAALLRAVVAEAGAAGVTDFHLEVRAGNPAIALYRAHGFTKGGERRGYYRGQAGELFDAHTYRRGIGA